jgi:hypothetical protein
MSRVISSFLVSIGYEVEALKRGEREISRSMEGVKSGFLQTGAAMSAAMIGAGMRVDDLAKKATNLDRAMYASTGATTWAQGLGASIKQAGGDAEEALSMIKRADQMRDQLSVGQGAWVDELARIGFNTGDLAQATDSEDLLRRISTQFSHLSDQQQRLAKEALGLSDASFKLFQQGGDALERQVSAMQKQQGYSQTLLNQQKEYTQQVIEAELAWDKLGNTVSGVMLPGMTELADKATGFINAADNFVKAHPEATERAATAGTAIAGGAAIAGIGALGSKIGIPGAGILRGAGPIGLGLGVAYGANEFAEWVDENSGPKKQLSDNGMYYRDSWVGQGVDWFTQPNEQPVHYFGFDKEADAERRNPYLSHQITQPAPQEATHPLLAAAQPAPREQIYPVPLVEQPLMTGYTPSYIEPGAANTPQVSRDSLMRGYDPSYLQSEYAGGMSDNEMERFGTALVSSLRSTGAIQVKNDVTLNAHVELDGRKMGDLVDDRISHHNQTAVDDMTTGIDR